MNPRSIVRSLAVTSLLSLAGMPAFAQTAPTPEAPAKPPATPAVPSSPDAAPANAPLAPTEPTAAEIEARMHPVELMRRDAGRLLPDVKSASVKQFLFDTNWLPVIDEPRVVHYKRETREALTPEQFEALDKDKREGFKEMNLQSRFFYQTMYGSPHAYARPLDLLCQAMDGGGNCFSPSTRLLDYGCGGVVQLRLLASQGVHAVGVDPDPLLRAYFREESDTGRIGGMNETVFGTAQFLSGYWPADEAIKQQVGNNYDAIISKNTLKKGYVTPDQPINPMARVNLGVSDEDFVKALFETLKPGGALIIYNVCGPQPREGYNPSADGRNPFPREAWEKAGFTVEKFDEEDHAGIRVVGKALGWDQGAQPMDLENGLFAWYSILKKPVDAKEGATPEGAKKDEAAPKPVSQ